eukprot:4613409-Pyramimonas_sp.AAC.1
MRISVAGSCVAVVLRPSSNGPLLGPTWCVAGRVPSPAHPRILLSALMASPCSGPNFFPT